MIDLATLDLRANAEARVRALPSGVAHSLDAFAKANAPTPEELVALGVPLDQWANGTWYELAAWLAIMQGHCCAILSRDGRDLYLLRCWLSAPRAGDDQRWDSGSSVLLHWIRRPDSDADLHDHPWDFVTTPITGGYSEALPTNTWPGKLLGYGPPEQSSPIWRRTGETVVRKAEDLHRIVELEKPGERNHRGDWIPIDKPPVAWTLVRTGPRRRSWGFHPAGKPWVPWAAYLDENRAKTEAVTA